MHLVDEAGAQVLLDGGGASAEANIFSVGGGDGLLQRAVNAVGDEVEGGASFHGEWRARVVGENEDGHVVGRVVAPPTFPGVVWPGAADGAEHVAAEDPGTDVFKAAVGRGRYPCRFRRRACRSFDERRGWRIAS